MRQRFIRVVSTILYPFLVSSAIAQDCHARFPDIASDTFRRCIAEERELRLGKYVCFIDNSLGFQYSYKGSKRDYSVPVYSGPVKPPIQRFFIEIKQSFFAKAC